MKLIWTLWLWERRKISIENVSAQFLQCRDFVHAIGTGYALQCAIFTIHIRPKAIRINCVNFIRFNIFSFVLLLLLLLLMLLFRAVINEWNVPKYCKMVFYAMECWRLVPNYITREAKQYFWTSKMWEVEKRFVRITVYLKPLAPPVLWHLLRVKSYTIYDARRVAYIIMKINSIEDSVSNINGYRLNE